MITPETQVKLKEAEIKATIIRKDGTREELGTIAYYHINPVMRVAWKIRRFFNGLVRH